MKPTIRALSASLLAAGIALCAAAPSANAAPPGPPFSGVPSAPVSSAGSSHQVTLITGDVVTLRRSGAGSVATVAGPNGRPTTARIVESNDEVFVYPTAVEHYVRAGTLDSALFNVTKLVADGFDDAHAAQLPLIVSYPDDAASRRADAVPAGAERVRSLSSIDALSVAESRATAAQFWAGVTAGTDPVARGSKGTLGAGISKIWLDGKVHATLDESTTQIGAQEAWSDGNTGEGVTVAVLDTGIDDTHPDLAGKINSSASFVPDEADIRDRAGHGTHVASTIAGTGAASGGKERGVAPGAMLDVGKVLDGGGTGQSSWIIAGMEWAAREKGAKIISMSVGGAPSDGNDPMSQAVNDLSAETGALFIIAAGNAGAASTVATPAAADAALTVAAVDGTDALAEFSSQGPRLGDHAIKPEISAPGVGILAARSQFASDGLTGLYRTMNGTSMATPHVAGAAALLLHERPELSGPDLKSDLISTSKPTPKYSPFQAGSGRVDVSAAIESDLIAAPTASVDRADADTNGIVSQPITYKNLGSTALTIDLSVDASHAPAGLFTISADTLTVPAHGTAFVTMATTLSKATNADTTAQVVAKHGSAPVVRTAVALAPLTHKLTLSLKGQNGDPVFGGVDLISDAPGATGVVDVEGTRTISLPEGTYSAMSTGTVEGIHGPNSFGAAIVGTPEFSLTKDTSITLDFSKAQQVQTIVPQVTQDTFLRIEYARELGDVRYRSALGAPSREFDSIWTVPTAKVKKGRFEVMARWRKEQPEFRLTTATHEYSDATRQLSTTALPKGTSKPGLVFAGDGTPEELAAAKVKGKLVVVHRNPQHIYDEQQAAAAVAAGAVALVVVNNNPGIAINSYAPGGEITPLEVVLVSPDEGALLIAEAQKKNAKASITSTPAAQYVYDVAQEFHNQTPKNLVKHEDSGTLARVDQDFSSSGPAPDGGGEFRNDFPAYDETSFGGWTTRQIAPSRTDWVSVSDAYSWAQEAFVAGKTYEYAPKARYAPGSTNRVSWYKPITRPYLNDAYAAPTRTDDGIVVDVPGFGGGDHVGLAQSGDRSQTTTLYQGSTLLATNPSSYVEAAGLPSATLPYRVVTKTTQTPVIGALSPSTTTQWNFTSSAPTQPGSSSVLPMTQLDYAITANAKGVVKNESTVRITPQKLIGATGGSLGKPTVALSYDDGKTWRSATVTAGPNGSWTVTVEALLRTKFVSIRTDLADSKGNSVSQTIIRAFGVK